MSVNDIIFQPQPLFLRMREGIYWFISRIKPAWLKNYWFDNTVNRIIKFYSVFHVFEKHYKNIYSLTGLISDV
jgi:hypothetical protein